MIHSSDDFITQSAPPLPVSLSHEGWSYLQMVPAGHNFIVRFPGAPAERTCSQAQLGLARRGVAAFEFHSDPCLWHTRARARHLSPLPLVMHRPRCCRPLDGAALATVAQEEWAGEYLDMAQQYRFPARPGADLAAFCRCADDEDGPCNRVVDARTHAQRTARTVCGGRRDEYIARCHF